MHSNEQWTERECQFNYNLTWKQKQSKTLQTTIIECVSLVVVYLLFVVIFLFIAEISTRSPKFHIQEFQTESVYNALIWTSLC